MGWKGKHAFEGGGMLLGAFGLIALVAGYLVTPSSSLAKASDLYWGSSLAMIGSLLLAIGVALFVIARMRDDSR